MTEIQFKVLKIAEEYIVGFHKIQRNVKKEVSFF